MTKKANSKKHLLMFLLLSAIGLILRLWGITFESGDWYESLSVWVKELDHGGLNALANYSGNYNMPYVTFLLFVTYLPVHPLIGIKSLSILFDYICAFVGGRLAVLCSEKEGKERTFLLAYGGILLAPTVIVNSAWWGQCDSVYVGFVFLALLYMLKDKTVRSMIFWGAALAFKLQTVLALPVLLLYYWKNRKFSFVCFLLIPLTVEMLCLPAILGGCSPFVALTTYLGQTGENQAMYYFYSNFWTFFEWAPYWVFGRMAVIGTVLLLLLLGILILRRETGFDERNFLPYFIWLVMTALCFLPNMHDRYGYMLELGLILYAAAYRRNWWMAVCLQGITMILYAPVLLRRYLDYDPRIWASLWLLIYFVISFERIGALSGKDAPPDSSPKALPKENPRTIFKRAKQRGGTHHA